MMLEKIMEFIFDLAPPKSGCFIGLMTESHLVNFYRNHGFTEYPKDVPAMRIWRNGH